MKTVTNANVIIEKFWIYSMSYITMNTLKVFASWEIFFEAICDVTLKEEWFSIYFHVAEMNLQNRLYEYLFELKKIVMKGFCQSLRNLAA